MTQNRPPPYMSTFTELKIGRVPITEEGVDRYRISDSILNHFEELSFLEDLNVSVGRIWSEMKVPLPWLQICTANYITGTIEFNNPAASSLKVRGWIDSVEPVSDTEDFPVCRVKWHFDFWEMYKAVASYDYGQVKRRPFVDIPSTPVQNYPYVYKKIDNSFEVELSGATSIVMSYQNVSIQPWWIILARSRTKNDKTYIDYYTFPLAPPNSGQASFDSFYYTSGGHTYKTLTIYQVADGLLDEYLGINPKEISGVWISPLCPFETPPTFGGTNIHVELSGGSFNYIYLPNEDSTSQYFAYGIKSPFTKQVYDTPFVSKEGEEYVVLAPDGSIVGVAPYGMEIKSVRVGVEFSATDANMVVQFVFRNTLNPVAPYNRYDNGGRAEGTIVYIPLPTLPVNENAWSDYLYSGQRDYDRRVRQVNTNSSAVSNIVNGAIGGGIAGGFSEKGALIGAAAGAASGVITYGVDTFYTNDEIQKSEDRLRSHQPAGILLSGDGVWTSSFGPRVVLKKIVFDDYSASQLSNTRSNYGISVDEILSSCDSLIRTTSPTGFYQIPNLIISGPLPVEAKDTIKQKFSAGVRLI